MLRPNPIGLTLVELVKVEDNMTAGGLDAFDGSPVINIKPYDNWHLVKDARFPSWWMKLAKHTENGMVGWKN